MKTFEIFVPGIARTSGSHISFKGRVTHSGKHTKKWMDTVAWMALKEYGERQILHDGEIKLGIEFYLIRPKGHYGTGRNRNYLKPSAPLNHKTKPDLDKLVRAVQDALTKVIWHDDSQIVCVSAAKYYETDNQKPGVKIIVYMYDHPTERISAQMPSLFKKAAKNGMPEM